MASQGSGLSIDRQNQLAALFGDDSGCVIQQSIVSAIYDDIFNGNVYTEPDINFLYKSVGYCKSNTSQQYLNAGEATVYRVIDGDTIEILECDTGTCQLSELLPVRVRLYDVDADEISTQMGKQASDWLQAKLPTGTKITFQLKDTDSYGRKVLVVYRDTENINESLIASGYAIRWKYATPGSDEDQSSTINPPTDTGTKKGAVFDMDPATAKKPSTIRLGMNNWFSINVTNIGDAYGKAYLGVKLQDKTGGKYEYAGDSTYAKGFDASTTGTIKALVPVPTTLQGDLTVIYVLHMV